MENKLKQICTWVNDIVDLSKPIQQNKLSSAELKALLQIVDVKRKGYLDLNDVYELAGNVTENELFAIFKFLDTQRTGEIGLQELQSALGDRCSSSKNTTKEFIFPKFYAAIDAIKDKPRLVSQSKKKYGFTPPNLKLTYQYVCNLIQSKYLTCQELVTVLKAQAIKYGMKWGAEQESVIKQLLPDQNISEARFVQFFSCETKLKAEVQEQCLLSGIQPQNSVTAKLKTSQLKVSPITLNKEQPEKEWNPSIIYKKTNNYLQRTPNDSPSFRSKPKQTFQPEQKADYAYTKQFDAMEGNVNEALSSIQQRKQKLRQDSLERKKLIEDVMNRKRQTCATSSIPSSPQPSPWKTSEEMFKRSGQDREKNSKSYLNKTYQKGASSYKQPGQYESSLLKNSYQTPEFAHAPQAYPQMHESSYISRKSSINDLKVNLERQLSSSIRKDSRPFTPQQPKYEINDILKKYNNFGNSCSKPKFQEQESNSLKQLCKSKSGFIYSQSPDCYQRPIRDTVQNYQMSQFAYQQQRPTMNKENILKRAQEQANRKIEQIERKARMKVLQKKGMSRSNKQEWGKLLKRGCYY